MRFEEYLSREIWQTTHWEDGARVRRAQRQTREMLRRRRRELNFMLVMTIIWLIVMIAVFGSRSAEQEITDPIHQITPDTEPPSVEVVETPAIETAAEVLPEELETTELCISAPVTEEPAAEPESAEPVYYDIKLSRELQDTLRGVCEEAGVSFELALSVIWKETNYRNLTGDGGKSYGYMQVQPRWHSGRMEKLGVTDLMDPESNSRVGCDFLAELLSKYPLANALAYYNSGSTRVNRYAEKVMNYMEELV